MTTTPLLFHDFFFFILPTMTSALPNGTIRVYKARVVHSLALGELEVLEPGAVGVDEDGRVLFCEAFHAFRARSEAPAALVTSSSADESTENEHEHDHEHDREDEDEDEDEDGER